MSDSRVRVDIEEKEDTRNGVAGFLLMVRVSNPEDFPEYLQGVSPECSFVYNIPDINFVQDITFTRVASIADLRELPVTFSKSGDTFRTSTYSKFFTSIEELLAAEEILIRDLRSLYSDIKTLFTYIQTSKQRTSYVLPDYVEETVDTLINQLLSSRVELTTALAKYSLIETTLLPSLEFNMEAVKLQLEDIDYYLSQIKAQMSMKTVSDTSAFASNAETVADSAAKWAEYYAATANMTIDLTAINATYKGIIDDPNLPIGLDDYFGKDNTYMEQFQDIYDRTALLIKKATDSQVEVTVEESSLIRFVSATNIYKGIAMQRIVAVDKFEKVQEAVKANQAKLEQTKSTLTNEKNTLAAQIEQLKGEIQDTEIQLKKLVPTIDITNPQNFWSVNVNITTTS